jgi:fructokinase
VLVVDPNVRLDRSIDPEQSVRRLRELCSLAQIIKASDEDLATLWPDTEPDEMARRLAREGRLVVLTRGARGSTAYTRSDEPVSMPPVPVRVVNTIGAGDAFMAGMLSWLSTNGSHRGAGAASLGPAPVADMLDFASRVAASVVAQSGTEPERPTEP